MISLKKLILLIFLIIIAFSSANAKLFTLSGILTDFEGNPLSGGVIRLMGSSFKDVAYEVATDSEGKFSIQVEAKKYLALFACKDYAVNFLEYWYWGLVVDKDINLEMKTDLLEVYGMKAWNPHNGQMIYFRPMSLTKAKPYIGVPEDELPTHLKIAPVLTKESIKAAIDDKEVEVLNLTNTQEFTVSGRIMDAYMVQVTDPADKIEDEQLRRQTKMKNRKLCINIEDSQSLEKGMGCTTVQGGHAIN